MITQRLSCHVINVTNLDVAMLVNEKVLRLKISVDQVERMEVLKCQDYLGCIKSCVWFTMEEKRRL